MAARLKVYEAEIDGLHEWIVAAPNQRAALDAFGVHQDLFAQGLARVHHEGEGSRSANAQPGVPLRRRKGSSDPFKPVQSSSGDAWKQAAAALPKSAKKAKPPSRTSLDRAEHALADFDRRATDELGEIAEEREALDARERQLRARQETKRLTLAKAVDTARAAYRDAGGRD